MGGDADGEAEAVRRLGGDEVADFGVCVVGEPLDELLGLGGRNFLREGVEAWFCHNMVMVSCLRCEEMKRSEKR